MTRQNVYSEEMLNLANTQVDEAISNALTSLTRILSLPCISLTTTPSLSPSSTCQNSPLSLSTHSLQPNISIRCRSSSRHNRRERKSPFHHTIPRCSLPATKNDLVHCQARLLSYQEMHRQSSQNLPSNSSNRTFDIQYSYSLNKPWLTKIDKQRHHLISIQNFVNELIEHSIRAAFIQIDYQNLSNSSGSIYEGDTSCLLFDCSPSYIPAARVQQMNSYVDQLIASTIQQSIDQLSSSDENVVDRLATRLTEDILTDALTDISDHQLYSKSLLTDDEKQSRKNKQRSAGTIRLLNNENNESQTSLFQQIRHRSSSAYRTLTSNNSNNNNHKRDSLDTIVTNLAQQIYSDSFEELRRIFAKSDGK